jgi:hypothetical protein
MRGSAKAPMANRNKQQSVWRIDRIILPFDEGVFESEPEAVTILGELKDRVKKMRLNPS